MGFPLELGIGARDKKLE